MLPAESSSRTLLLTRGECRNEGKQQMISDDLARALHDKATRGISLSAAAQAELERWYALRDEGERQQLVSGSDPETAVLRTQVNAALAELTSLSRGLQASTAENERLRAEIAGLQERLARLPVPQPA